MLNELMISSARDSGLKKSCRPRSWCWKHFTKLDNSINHRAKCNWFGVSYMANSHRNGTRNLKSYFLNQCKKFP